MKPKFCKDCKWSHGDGTFMKCKSTRNPTETDYSTGKTKSGLLYCSIIRDDGFVLCRILGICGKEARFFEPKTDGDKND